MPEKERGRLEYHIQRLKAIGVHPGESNKYGIDTDAEGNIRQYIRTFTGEQYEYLTDEGKRLQKLAKSRKTFTGDALDENRHTEPLYLLRYHPEVLERKRKHNPDIGKYRYPSKERTGYGVLPMPTPLAVERYTSKMTGGIVSFTEGYFKASAMDVAGIETTSFSGIQSFKIEGETKEYIQSRKPEAVVILYDGDARLLKGKLNDKRPRNFYNSVMRFASDFFQMEGQKATLYFAMVKEDLPEKGMDDLLEARPDEREDIISEYNSRKTGKYFRFVKLSKTSHKRKLERLFALDSPRSFYERYKAEIGNHIFVFNGIQYQHQRVNKKSNLFTDDIHQLRMVSNPLHVEFSAVDSIQVNRYLSEKDAHLDNILDAQRKVAIEAPTGAGKTSYFLGHGRHKGWIDLKKEKAVFVVPTVSLCKQIGANTKGVHALHGTVTPMKRNKALQASKIVCTYDVLHHITDLPERVLIVDEAHNLINHHGFRSKVLQRVVERFDVARKTVLLSGTPPRHLVKELDFHFIAVTRHENNMAVVRAVESDKDSPRALIASTVAEIKKGHQPGKIDFCFYNDTEALERIKDVLISSGHYQPEEIDIITRTHVDSQESRTINEITTYQKVKSNTKLVLTSCLIAEGVNIQNDNIGAVYMVNNRSIDNFRQFIARFRSVDRLNVVSIRPPEKGVDSSFKRLVSDNIDYLKGTAQLQLKAVQREMETNRLLYDDSEAAFYDDIQPAYNYHSQTVTEFIYLDNTGAPRMDILKVVRVARDRVEQNMDNIFFYSQLDKYPNITFTTDATSTTDATDVLEDIKAVEDKEKDIRGVKENELKAVLLSQPAVAVAAYVIGLDKAGNRGQLQMVKAMVGDMAEPTPEAENFREQYRPFFKKKWFNQIIVAFCKLHGIGAGKDVIKDRIQNFQVAKFNQEFNRLKHTVFSAMYENSYQRKKLSARHRLDIRFYNLVKDHTQRAVDKHGSIDANKAEAIIHKIVTRQERNNRNEVTEKTEGIRVTPAKVKSILNDLFDIETTTRYKYKSYQLSKYPTPFGDTTPPAIVSEPDKLLLISYEN